FFVNYWQFSVHGPFDAKKNVVEKYEELINPNDEQRSPTYAAMVEALDDNVGKVLDSLDRLGLTEKTIIVFFSDNGGNMYNEIDGTTPTSNRPLRGGKGNNWDGGVRVPAIVVWPGKTKPGSRNRDLVTSTDFYPTLLEMADLPPTTEHPLDGSSLVPLLRSQESPHRPIFTFFPHSTKVPDTLPPSAAIYEEHWKLLRLFWNAPDGSHEEKLFNLEEDPGEENDLASAHPELVKKMGAQLAEFLESTGAVYPLSNPDYDPITVELTKAGWRPGALTKVTKSGGALWLDSSENKVEMTQTLAEALPSGTYEFLFELTPATGAHLDLRWGEEGVKPLFFRDRLEKKGAIPAGEQSEVRLIIEARHPITAFRIDVRRPRGKVILDRLLISHDGKLIRDWSFE
ncbi:MAG: sulfatase-like hydrolase/transferase, partial [Verrucomicrobiota bacterium]